MSADQQTSSPLPDRPTYTAHTGVEFSDVSSERVVAEIDIEPHHHQPWGVVHGGVYCTLIETLASTGAALHARDNGMAGAVGLTNKTDFIKAVGEGTVVGTATPIYRGRNHQLWQVDVVVKETDRLVAQGQVRLQNIADMF